MAKKNYLFFINDKLAYMLCVGLLGWLTWGSLIAADGYQVVRIVRGAELTGGNLYEIGLFGLKTPDGTVHELASREGIDSPLRFTRILGVLDEKNRTQVLKAILPDPGIGPDLVRSLDSTKLVQAGFDVDAIEVSPDGAKLFLQRYDLDRDSAEPEQETITLDQAGLVTRASLPGTPDHLFYAKECALIVEYFQERGIPEKKLNEYLGEWKSEQSSVLDQHPSIDIYPKRVSIAAGKSISISIRAPESIEPVSVTSGPSLGFTFGSITRSATHELDLATYNLLRRHLKHWVITMTASKDAKPRKIWGDDIPLIIATNQGNYEKILHVLIWDHQPVISDVHIEVKGKEAEIIFTVFDEKGDLFGKEKSLIVGCSFFGGLGGTGGVSRAEKIEDLDENRFRVTFKESLGNWAVGKCDYSISVDDVKGITSTGGEGSFVFPGGGEK